MKIAELIDEYLNHIYIVQQKTTATRNSYSQELKKYATYLEDNNIALEKVDNELISDFLVFLSNNNYQSINHTLTAIRGFHDYLNRYHSEDLNFAVQLKGKKVAKSLPTFLTQSEVDTLINNCESLLDQTIIVILYASGMRVSELVNLKLNNLHLESGFIRCLGKRDKERIIPLFPLAVAQLQLYLQNRQNYSQSASHPFVFINPKGQQISRQYVFTMIKENCKKNGLSASISPHSLRHTFASLLLDNGADLRVIQELLGHADIATTQIYTHLQTTKLRSTYDQFHPGKYFDTEN